MLKHMESTYPCFDIVAGKIVTREQATALMTSGAGADALRVDTGSRLIRIIHGQEVMAVGPRRQAPCATQAA